MNSFAAAKSAVAPTSAAPNSAGVAKFWSWSKGLIDPKRAIINPLADAFFFYGAPVWALALVLAGASQPDLWYVKSMFADEYGYVTFVTGAATSAHLLAVMFRSHLNPAVFTQWPMRFTLVPVGVFLLLTFSPWALVAASALAIFWDVYHSGMQNFGLARIYDMRAGNSPTQGRLLDSLISQVLYAGPIMAGASLYFHFEGFDSFEQFLDGGFSSIAEALTTIPAHVDGKAEVLRNWVFGVSALAWCGYLYGYWRLAKQGYNVAPQKVILMAATALTSLIAWVYCEPVVAFAVMNLFHAVQYFAIVWGREHKTIGQTFRIKNPKLGKWVALALILGVCAAFGAWEMLWANPGWDATYAFILTVALMHFWYDGFIWSVRKKAV